MYSPLSTPALSLFYICLPIPTHSSHTLPLSLRTILARKYVNSFPQSYHTLTPVCYAKNPQETPTKNPLAPQFVKHPHFSV